MTVAELRRQLDGLDPKMRVVVTHESDGGMDFFEISDVSPAKGDPNRNADTCRAGFKFDKAGPATWLFIAVDEA